MSVIISPVGSMPADPMRFALPGSDREGFNPFLVLHERERGHFSSKLTVASETFPNRGYGVINYIVAALDTNQEPKRLAGTFAEGSLFDDDVNQLFEASETSDFQKPVGRSQQKTHDTHGFQIWLRSPRSSNVAPQYKHYAQDDVAIYDLHGIWVVTLVGAFKGIHGPLVSDYPAFVAHVRLSARADVAFPVEPGATTLIYAMHGSAQLGSQLISAGHLAMINDRRDYVAVGAGAQGFEALVLSALRTAEYDLGRDSEIDELGKAYATFQARHLLESELDYERFSDAISRIKPSNCKRATP